jgi:hypothetical protein
MAGYMEIVGWGLDGVYLYVFPYMVGSLGNCMSFEEKVFFLA